MSAKGFDPAELLQVLVDIARSGSRSHITSEYRRCVDSSCAGSTDSESQPLSPLPTQTPATHSPSGGAPSVLHTEDHWWTAQDRDERWLRQWDVNEGYDNIDPKSWK